MLVVLGGCDVFGFGWVVLVLGLVVGFVWVCGIGVDLVG